MKLSRSRDFARSETVVRASEAANRFFLIKAGCVDYFIHTPDGREVLLRRLAPPEVFGFGAFFGEPMGYLGTAVACRRTTVLVWSRHSIRAIGRNYPKFVWQGIAKVSREIVIVQPSAWEILNGAPAQRLGRLSLIE